MNYVLPVRKGGLGNQMFQVAAAIVYQEAYKKEILLPDEFYNYHNKKGNDYSKSIFKSFTKRLNQPMDEEAIQMIERLGWKRYPGEPGFEVWKALDLEGNIILHGYFQSYSSLQPYEDIIRSTYLANLKDIFNEHIIHPSKDFVAIHVRRGDYLTPPINEVLPVQNISYYEEALKHFDTSKVFLIFSDDLAWCKQQEVFLNLPKKIFMDEPDEVISLALMASCRGGFICANSSFSWWGAFLGAHADNSTIIAPLNWIKDGCGTLLPPSWIKL